MLKKIVLAGVIAVASLVSLNVGTGTTSVSIPAAAKACSPLHPTCGPYYCC
jgi:hypothetical protein